MYPLMSPSDNTPAKLVRKPVENSVIAVEKWSAEDCRVYLRSIVNRGDDAAWQVADLVSRVRTRLASLQAR